MPLTALQAPRPVHLVKSTLPIAQLPGAPDQTFHLESWTVARITAFPAVRPSVNHSRFVTGTQTHQGNELHDPSWFPAWQSPYGNFFDHRNIIRWPRDK